MITFKPEPVHEIKPIKSKGKILIIPASWTDNKQFKSLGHGLVWICLDELDKQDIK